MEHVIILAGGKGERLRPLTEDRPKAMIPVMGNPLLAFQLRWLRASGFKKVIISCGYMNEVIRNYFGDGSKFQVDIQYLIEEQPLGRGGGLKNALKQIRHVKTPILAINGDSMTNLNLSDFIAFHKKEGGIASLATVPLKSPYGIVEYADSSANISGFTEKPELPFWINAGMYVMEPEIFDLLPDIGDHEEMTFPKLALEGKLKGYKTRAFWRTVDTVKDLSELRAEVEQVFFGAFLQNVPV